MTTIKNALDRAVARYGDALWMAFQGDKLSFARLGRDVERIARGLAALGVEHGGRAGLFLDNRPEWLEIEYAVTGLGASLVPINTMFRSRELTHIIGKSRLDTLIWAGSVLGHDALGTLSGLVPELSAGPPGCWRSERFPDLRRVIGIGPGDWPAGVTPWEDVLERAQALSVGQIRERFRRVSADDIALVMYTSGTTGAPKGAVHTHRGLNANTAAWTRHLGLRPDDRSVLASPLFWIFGCWVNALVPLHAGSAIILQTHYDPEQFLDDIVAYRCTHLQGVPSQYELALEHPRSGAYDLSRLRLVQIGGSASAGGLAGRLMERAPRAKMISAYGLTEAGPITYTELDDPIEDVMGSVGHVNDNTEAVICDGGRELPCGEVGELCVRGASVMAGYLDDPEATAAALRDGWLRTGDLARMDDRGYITITGRASDAYKRGGMNVYPAEVEALLAEHPAVQMAAVIGVPDPRLGQAGTAFVVARPGATLDPGEVIAFCAARIAHYKVPARVQVVTGLPMTPSGKVQKFKLRDML